MQNRFVRPLALMMMTATAFAQPKPPAPPKRPVVDDYHGTKITDPYRYMEDLQNPEVRKWMLSQSEYAARALDAIPAKAKLLERIQELDQGAPYTISRLARLADGTILYHKLAADAEVRVVCMRKNETAEEKVVLDPKWYEKDGGSHASLEFFVPSPDGRYGVAGISRGGSEITTIFVRDLAAGKDLEVTIDRIETAYNAPQWLPDSSGFFYSRRRKLPEGAPAADTYKHTTALLHRIGEPVEKDLPVFGLGLTPGIEFAPMDFPSVRVYPGSPYLIGQIHHGDSQEVTLYTARLDAMTEKGIPWKKVCDAADGVVAYTVQGEWVYLVTSKDAPRFKVVRVPLAEPDFAKAQEVLPESELVVNSVRASKDAVFVNATRNGSGVVMQIDPSGKTAPKRLAVPGNLAAYVTEASPHFPHVFLSAESWTKGGALYGYDPAEGKFRESKLQPKGKYDDVPGYASVQVEVASHDGVKVPLSIIYKEGLVKDGTAPLMLNGYGAYGSIRYEGFSPVNLAWLERGGVIAVAHVRGGGEKGKEWHLAGQKATKPNTWKDLIACAEYLCAEKYTSPKKLAIQGGSAGGILIGRAITTRPDLFGAALILVGATDMLRFETTENGPPNVEEFGSTQTPEGFAALREMSPLYNVRDGEKYPAVLLTHGMNDRRVDAWMSAKMSARLQEATGSGKPVLLLLDSEAGHGIGSKRSQIQEQLAYRWAFALWQLGDPEFQPAPAPVE